MIIWIASYPKSGNTWLRSFLSTYIYTNDNLFEFDHLKKIKQFNLKNYTSNNITNVNDAITNLENAQKKIISEEENIFLKTHSSLIPINGHSFTSKKYTAGAIYIVRDPRNVITSLGNHYNLNFQESLEFMSNSKKYIIDDRKDKKSFSSFQFISSWSNNVMSWKNCQEFKVLFIKYEDLEKNQNKVFLDILYFLNNILKNKIKISEIRVKNIIDSISFDLLKKKELDNGFPESVENKNKKKVSFFFLGKENKWNKIFDNEKIDKLNNSFKESLIKLGYF